MGDLAGHDGRGIPAAVRRRAEVGRAARLGVGHRPGRLGRVHRHLREEEGDFLAKSNLTPARFAAVNKEAAAKGLALSSVDAFGTAGDVRYAAVWSANTGGAWNYTYGKSRQQHEAEVYAKKEEGYRPVRASVAPDGTYAAVWRKDGVKSWAHYVDMSASGYQKRFDDLKGKGLHPVQVNAENGKYVAIWE
ncbi:hypothetical protein ACFQYP_44235 [Nonomuraea antimicrobica]